MNNNIRIALTKGRLENEAIILFEKVGLNCKELHDKGRKLVFYDYKNNVEFLLVKAADVLTYVEYGVADIGIVGKDTLMEQQKDLYEVLDLRFGKCKFSLAALKDNKPIIGYTKKKIATKYPSVTRKYFEDKGEDVEIIKIEGSVELAPIMGLSHAILDIVETGKTLEENGLEVFEDVCNLSARMIVNPASMKMKKEEITKLIEKLQLSI